MNPQLTVLVTGAGSLLGQGILRALRASSLRLRIIAVDASPLSAGLYWADAAHLIPMATEPGYLPSIGAIFAQEKPDAVLIGTDVELGVLAQHRERQQLRRAASLGSRIVIQECVGTPDDEYTAGALCLRRLQGPIALSGREARHRYAKHDRPASHQGGNRSASIGESMRGRRPHPGGPS